MHRRPRLFALLGLGLLAGLGGPAPARAAVTTNISVPIDGFQAFVPCANGGAGETLDLTGPLHVLLTFTMDAKGGVHGVFHFQPQGVIGVGETSGDIWHAVGLTEEEINTTVGHTDSFVNNFRMIGAGPGNNLYIHEVAHMTINANGSVTVNFDKLSMVCK